jgi:hypothetical protein
MKNDGFPQMKIALPVIGKALLNNNIITPFPGKASGIILKI